MTSIVKPNAILQTTNANKRGLTTNHDHKRGLTTSHDQWQRCRPERSRRTPMVERYNRGIPRQARYDEKNLVEFGNATSLPGEDEPSPLRIRINNHIPVGEGLAPSRKHRLISNPDQWQRCRPERSRRTPLVERIAQGDTSTGSV